MWEIGKHLPLVWTAISLEDLIIHALGGAWGRPPEPIDNGWVRISVIRGTEFRFWNLEKGRTAELRSIPEASLDRRSLLPGDIIIEISGGSPDQPVGRTLLFDVEAEAILGKGKTVCSNFCKQIRLVTCVNSTFVQQYLHFLWLQGQLDRFQSQPTNLRNLSFPAFVSEIKVPIPPKNEQQRIVKKIEELQSLSRKAMKALEAIPDLLEQLRQSILAAAFRGDLTKKWREQHKDRIEPAAELLKRIRIERRKRWEAAELDKLKAKGLTGDPLDAQFAKRCKQYMEPAPVDTTNLPELPEGWCWVRTDEISENALGKMLDKQKHTKGIKLPYLRNVNVRWGAVDISDLLLMYFKDSEIDRYSIRKGDIIVCEGGEPGRATVWENEDFVLYQKALHRVRPFKGIDPWLMVFQLWHDSKLGILEKYFTGTTIKHFTGRSLQQYPVCLPPIIEQKRIVEKIKATFNQIEKLYEKVNELQNQCSSIDSTILSKAFRGELVPQDPNDEPASILLERIRQEKERQIAAINTKPKQKGRKIKRPKTAQQDIIAVLQQAARPMTPEELFAAGGFGEDSIDAINKQLSAAIAAKKIRETRKGATIKMEVFP